MAKPLRDRLEKLETSIPENRPRRYVKVVGDARDPEAAYEFLRANGYDVGPDGNDFAIVNLIVLPQGRELPPIEPYLLPRHQLPSG